MDTPEQNFPYHWYAIRVKSRAEKKVFDDLQRAGIEAFLPLQRRLRQWSDRKKWVEMVLISGYVFVRISRREYDQVLKITHVVCYIFFEGKAAVIRDHDITLLKRMLGQHDLELEVSTEVFKVGQLVEILTGPLCGMTGELVEIQGKNKVALRIPPIGYTILVESPSRNLKAVKG